MIICIINTDASRADSERDGIQRSMKNSKIDCISVPGAELKQVISAALKQRNLQRLIVGGGDGTIALAASIVEQSGRSTQVELAILPIGTANQYAKTIGLSHANIGRSVETAVKSKNISERYIGYVNTSGFLLAATVGVSAKTFRVVTKRHKQRFGTLAYLYGLLVGFRSKLPSFSIENSGKVTQFSNAELVVLNQALPGPIATLSGATGAKSDFDVYVYGSDSGKKLSALFSAALHILSLGRIQKNITQLHTNELLVDGLSSVQVAVDGDIREQLPAIIKMSPSRVQFVSVL